MAKKDGAKARRKSRRVQYELTMSAEAAAVYLEGLAAGLRSGAVSVGEGGDGFQTTVDGDVDLAVDARRGKRKSRVDLSLAFRGGQEAETPTSDDAAVATIPDEMSF